MADTIAPSELYPGDILLYRGTELISKAIQLLDRTEVSHVALYMGGGTVAEALFKEGLITRTLPASVRGGSERRWRLCSRAPAVR
jgi:cell wall-associated NlpC family hydrolase